ncbi:hypothetical protein [Litchfieldia salsa]|uniref:Uncharacterized protein n=1 Tax=Litchfieldia salsa TaxID=930152 RepID=A0A1H0W7G2_9BACI|nr:hypothetical protein [Litchfieldia salsa]SDP86680.1 hypothetical protein SAMN05216565_109160 [Litchfieldia salsa]
MNKWLIGCMALFVITGCGVQEKVAKDVDSQATEEVATEDTEVEAVVTENSEDLNSTEILQNVVDQLNTITSVQYDFINYEVENDEVQEEWFEVHTINFEPFVYQIESEEEGVEVEYVGNTKELYVRSADDPDTWYAFPKSQTPILTFNLFHYGYKQAIEYMMGKDTVEVIDQGDYYEVNYEETSQVNKIRFVNENYSNPDILNEKIVWDKSTVYQNLGVDKESGLLTYDNTYINVVYEKNGKEINREYVMETMYHSYDENEDLLLPDSKSDNVIQLTESDLE